MHWTCDCATVTSTVSAQAGLQRRERNHGIPVRYSARDSKAEELDASEDDIPRKVRSPYLPSCIPLKLLSTYIPRSIKEDQS